MNEVNNIKHIKSLSIKQLNEFVLEHHLPKFRTKQILEWLYLHNVDCFDNMSNLPNDLIKQLKESFYLSKLKLNKHFKSNDGTVKLVLESNYKNTIDSDKRIFIETVGIPSKNNKLTVCVSSQAGCAMGCKFCATGQQGFTRNLYIGEIIDQIHHIQDIFNTKATNIVVMGQGEPFLNFSNVISALEIINNQKLINIGARKITISTCGIIPGINAFAKIQKQYGLAISLHSAIQETRNSIMPSVKKYNLEELKQCIFSYIQKTNRRVSFEYLLIKDVNDDQESLFALIDFCDGLLCHINLLNINEVPNSPFKQCNYNTVIKWEKSLKNAGIETSLRKSRGADIDAACGQLINKIQLD